MSNRRENNTVERSCRLFGHLLVMYPRAHRKEYGAAILQLFRDQCRDAWGQARMRGLIGFWIHAFADLLKTSFLEHLSNLNRNISMLKYFRPQFTPFPVFLRIFGGVFLFVFLASVIITFMSPEIFSSMAVIDMYFPSIDHNLKDTYALEEHLIRLNLETMKSHATLSKVSQELNLPTVWGKKYNGGKPMSEAEVESVMLGRLTLTQVRNTSFVDIRTYAESPEEAASLANKIVEAYRDVCGEQARQNPDTPATMVTLMDVAVPNRIPVRPNKAANTVLGMMLGGLLGLIAGTIGTGIVEAAKKHRNASAALNA